MPADKKKLPPKNLGRWPNRVAWNVLKKREELELSQAKLAVLSDVGVNTVLRLENGDSNITLDTLQKICHTLDLRFADLIELPDWSVGRRITEEEESGVEDEADEGESTH